MLSSESRTGRHSGGVWLLCCASGGCPLTAHEWPPHGNILFFPTAVVLLELVPFAWVCVTVQSLEKIAP